MANETVVITGQVRLSYVYLLTPKKDDNDKDKYSCAVLVPKSDTDTLNKIKAAVNAAKVSPDSAKKWMVAVGKVPGELKLPLRDGDLKAEEHPEYAGHYFFNCTSTQKPAIVSTKSGPDGKLLPITDPSEVYSGMYARVSVNFYPFNNSGNKGIAAGLRNVQKVADGEPLAGGRTRPEDDFGAGPTGGDDFLG